VYGNIGANPKPTHPENRREQEHKNHRKHDTAEITEQLLLFAQNKIFKHSIIPFYLMIYARYESLCISYIARRDVIKILKSVKY
jgi:hypothetical protein